MLKVFDLKFNDVKFNDINLLLDLFVKPWRYNLFIVIILFQTCTECHTHTHTYSKEKKMTIKNVE